MNGPGRLVGPMQINNYLREALAISSIVCYTHHINTGQIGACVPVGDLGTIPYSMRQEASTFPGAACDSSPMVLMEIDGSMSTLMPQSGQPVNKKNGIVTSLARRQVFS